MKLPATDYLIRTLHTNLDLDPLLKQEANSLIDSIDYTAHSDDISETICIIFSQKLDFSELYSPRLPEAVFKKEYLIRLDFKTNKFSFLLYFDNNQIELHQSIYKQSRFKKICERSIPRDVVIINKLFNTNFDKPIYIFEKQ